MQFRWPSGFLIIKGGLRRPPPPLVARHEKKPDLNWVKQGSEMLNSFGFGFGATYLSKLPLSASPPGLWIFHIQCLLTPFKGVRILEPRKFLLGESGIHENFAYRIRNPQLWSPESKFSWQRLESSTWDPESTAWNAESKTVLDSLHGTCLWSTQCIHTVKMSFKSNVWWDNVSGGYSPITLGCRIESWVATWNTALRPPR